jgi:uncharacterized membrane protein (DUF485 family)
MSQASAQSPQHKKRIRVMAVLLGVLALAFYIGFIALVSWGGQ